MDLVIGQRVKLSDLALETQLHVAVRLTGPKPAEVACIALLLGESQEAVSPSAIVSSERPRSDCGGVSMQARASLEHVFDVDLTRLLPAACNVLFAVGLLSPQRASQGCAGSIQSGQWVVEAGGRVVSRYSFTGSDFGDVGAITVGELYRKNGVWRLRAIGDGFVGGLPAMLSRYKVALDQVASPGAGDLSAAPAGLRLPLAWPGPQLPSVPKDLTRGVGLVITRTRQDTVHTGTGFIVTPGGHFVTCHHVVDRAAHLAICLDGTRELREAEIIAQDPEADLALCWMSDRNGSPDWLLLAGADIVPGLGDELGLLGFPLGVELGLSVTYSQGIVNNLRQRGNVSVLQIDVGAAPGSSGGPVFRRGDGKVLGVLTSGIDVQDRGMLINFAVDLRVLWKLGWVS